MTTTDLQDQILKSFGLETTMFKQMFYNKKTLRLTKRGRDMLKSKYAFWIFEDHDMVSKDSISLQRKMTYPYFMDKRILILFTEVDAFMAKMAGVKGWIDGK
tara:strand:+ start:182 stop:487 length:306 start_codon:yes stop_codon:yes gene_type:complete